jgi:hypothetical protein
MPGATPIAPVIALSPTQCVHGYHCVAWPAAFNAEEKRKHRHTPSQLRETKRESGNIPVVLTRGVEPPTY